MNALALLAYHKPHVDYTSYCNELYRTHLGSFISTIELKIGTFNDSDSRSLEDSALVRRIERIFPRGSQKPHMQLVQIPTLAQKKNAIALLQTLFNIEESHVYGNAYNFYPEAAQCAKNDKHLNIIAFIAFGKLSRILEFQWTQLSVTDVFSRLCEYVMIYRDRISRGWLSDRHIFVPLPAPSEALLWRNFIYGAGGANEQAKRMWLLTTRDFDISPALSTAAQNIQTMIDTRRTSSTATREIQTVPNTPRTPSTAAWGVGTTSSTTQNLSVKTDTDADRSFDYVSEDEAIESKNCSGVSVFEI